jgi:catechol 2,3-dioxygenase-like lactoylglutathione lyase family enzyme
MARYLHTMLRITDPVKSRSFYEALGFAFKRDMDIVRNGEREATDYFFGIGDQESVLELTFDHDIVTMTSAPATATSRSLRTTSSRRSPS